MIKKIHVKELKPGMYISDVNCGWLQHPFLSNSMKIKGPETIKKIIDIGIREVYIDTKRGLDAANAPTKTEVNRAIQKEVDKIKERDTKGKNTVPVQEELTKAKVIKKAAITTVKQIMNDVRLGRQMQMEKVDHVVELMVASIFRNDAALTSLGKIKQMDEYTYFHSVSVSILMISFGKHLGFDRTLIKKLGVGGLLHDIGKMDVPVEIITKKDGLTDDEYEAIKKHVDYGQKIIEQIEGIEEIPLIMSAEHHERMDGSGYPQNLQGDNISRYGQMVAITDVYDAMTSHRCYQKGMEPAAALKKLFEWSNYYFNNTLVQQFIRCVGIYPVGSLVRLESNMLGVILSHNENSLLLPVVRVIYNAKKEEYVMPYDIDLSECSGNGCAERIKSSESPHRWKIHPEMYL